MEQSDSTAQGPPSPGFSLDRENDAIYQGDPPQRVARVLEAEVDEAAKKVRFVEIYQSDWLLLPDECEFQKYRILIQRVSFASRIDKSAPEKGRVLRGVEADILGYRH